MTSNIPDHERLFDEICSKLNELSRARTEEEPVNHQDKMDRLQSQIRKFQTDLHETQSELMEKIKGLENVQVSEKNDLHHQLRQLTEQLNQERSVNTKLNQDLARSLELGLQLQLEIQGLKSRSQQIQSEERKFNQTLQDKVRALTHDLELSRALREEVETELSKARSRFLSEQETWQNREKELHGRAEHLEGEKKELLLANDDLMKALKAKEDEIASLHEELEKTAAAFNQLEGSTHQQQEAMKNLASVAENKIVELKLALDRKSAECRDFEGHLHQSLTQNQLLKQENGNLKDYIAKINVYLQNPAPAAPPPAASPQA